MSTPVICSFCGKKQAQVHKLIAAPGVCICNECVGLCCEILIEEVPGWKPPTCTIALETRNWPEDVTWPLPQRPASMCFTLPAWGDT